MRVLIVEDERLLAESLKTLLERKGFTVETAYDGISGAEYAETGIYDLLILDVMRLLMQAGENNTPKETILTYVWGFDSDAVENNVEVYIGFLRKKLKSLGSNVRIESVRRVGVPLGGRRMIRKLRVKLAAIIMAFVTVILACVMAAVLGLTRATLEHESLDMMRHIVLNPIQVPAPGEEFDGVRLPYFVLSVGEDGTTEPAGGGYYVLSDTEFLQQAAEEAVDSGRQNGVLTDSHLRFLRLDTDSGSTIVFDDTSNETQTLTGLFRTCLLLCSAAFIAF